MRYEKIWVQVQPESLSDEAKGLVRWIKEEKGLIHILTVWVDPADHSKGTRQATLADTVTNEAFKPCLQGEKVVVEEYDLVGDAVAEELAKRYPNKRDKSLAAAINYGLDLWERGRVKADSATKTGRGQAAALAKAENEKLRLRNEFWDKDENAQFFPVWKEARTVDKATGGNAAEEAFFASHGL